MARRYATKNANGSHPPVQVPDDLKEDEAITTTFSTTVQKSRAQADEDTISAEDLSDCIWHVEVQTADGWAFKDKVEGRPIEPDLRSNYGHGKFRVVPILNGNKVKRFQEVMTVLPATGSLFDQMQGGAVGYSRFEDEDDEEEMVSSPRYSERDWQDSEMPAWMRLQLQQANEERIEARRRQEEAERRREEWERMQAQREWERQEREERWQRERMKQEERERKERLEREEREAALRQDRYERERQERSQMVSTVLTAGTGILTAFIERGTAKPDINDTLLQSLMSNRNQPASNSSLEDQIRVLALLDNLRQKDEPPPREEKKDIMGDVLKLAPLLGLLGNKGGGAPQMPPQMPQQAFQQAPPQMMSPGTDEVLKDPEQFSRAAMKDPDGVAKAVMQAVKENPVLEQAVVKALSEG